MKRLLLFTPGILSGVLLLTPALRAHLHMQAQVCASVPIARLRQFILEPDYIVRCDGGSEKHGWN